MTTTLPLWLQLCGGALAAVLLVGGVWVVATLAERNNETW